MDTSDVSELECRVCRCGPEDDRPLFHPCLCSGSIGLVHQNCLETWLAHSNKDKCELCSTKYVFVAEYASNTPSTVPFNLVLKSTIKLFFFSALPGLMKLIIAIAFWLLFVPLWTCWVYRIYFREQSYKDVIIARSTISLLRSDIVSGLVIIGVILLSTIILMSFAEFVRLFWGDEIQPHRNRQQNNAGIPHARAAGEANVDIPNDFGRRAPRIIRRPREPRIQPIQRPVVPIERRMDNNRQAFAPPDLNHIGVAQQPDIAAQAIPEQVPPIVPDLLFKFSPKHVGPIVRPTSSEDFDPSLNSPHDSIGNDVPLLTPRSELYSSKIGSVDDMQELLDKASEYINADIAKIGESTSSDSLFNRVNSWSSTIPDNEETLLVDELDTSYNKKGIRPVSTPGDAALMLGLNTVNSIPDSVFIEKQPTELPSVNTNEKNEESGEENDDYDAESDDVDWENEIEEENWVEEEAENVANPGGADVEVRFALDELLGLRGPLFTIVKHVIWFLTFTGLYLFVFVFFPVSMGSIIVEVVTKHFPWVNDVVQFCLPVFFYDILIRAQKLSVENKAALCLSDLGLAIVGYFTIYIITTCWHFIMSFIRQTMFFSLDVYVKFLDNLVVAGKIGALLSVRIFLLPLTLGIIILYSWNVIFSFEANDIVLYLASNMVGCLTLAWTAGISYMLVITLSVLQLREILHPDILSKSIRPQETQAELLHSLVNESGWTHFRRLVTSMLVYLVLLGVILLIPFHIAKAILVHVLNVPKSDIKVWYFIAELQLPLEVAIGHFAMLTVLEGKKNFIGRFLYAWLLFISKQLKVTRFILPCPMKREPVEQSEENSSPQKLGEIIRDAHGVPRVGRPLRRPPPGWDARNHDHQIYDNKVTTRWAWGTEEPSEVEANVAPRLIPKDWLLKTFLLIASSWSLVTSTVVFLVVVPVYIGRSLMFRLCLPYALHHDPIAFFMGIALCVLILTSLRKLQKFGLKRIIESAKQIPIKTIFKVFEISMLGNAIHIFVNLIAFTTFKPSTSLNEIFTLKNLFVLWWSYRLLQYCALLLAINGGVQFVLSRLGAQDGNGLAQRCDQIRGALYGAVEAITQGRFDEESLQLEPIKSLLIWPLFDLLVIKGGLMIIGGWVSAACVKGVLSVISSIPPQEAQVYLLADNGILTYFNRLTTTFIIMYCISSVVSQPIISLHQHFYQAIKDENYLTGRKLQNVVGRM